MDESEIMEAEGKAQVFELMLTVRELVMLVGVAGVVEVTVQKS